MYEGFESMHDTFRDGRSVNRYEAKKMTDGRWSVFRITEKGMEIVCENLPEVEAVSQANFMNKRSK